MADKDGKTEKPTPKRLRDARQKGELTKSPELTSAVTFAVFATLIVPLWEFVTKQCFRLLESHFSKGYDVANLENNLGAIGLQSVLAFMVMIGPFLTLGFLSAWIVSLGQVGFLLTGKPLKPDFKRLNPISGFKNIFSSKAMFGLVKNLCKLVLIFYLTLNEIKMVVADFLNIGNYGVERLLPFVLEFIRKLSLKIAFVLCVLGIIDYIYQRFMFRKNLRMSKQDIKDEYKEQEGDPHVKSQRRGMYQQMVGGMMNNVKDATVVLTNPTHLAIAIRYDKSRDGAPIVIAKGADFLAQKIREEAKSQRIPLIENKPVARALYKSTNVGEPIPIEMYETMAEVLALVYQINEANKGKI